MVKIKQWIKRNRIGAGIVIGLLLLFLGYLFFRQDINMYLWGVSGFIFGYMFSDRNWLKGSLIGGGIGLITSIYSFSNSFLPKLLGNELINTLSHGGAISGFYILSINIIIILSLIGGLIGYFISKR